MQAKAHLKLVTPTGKKRAVAPQRRPNSEYRKREHLTPAEVAKLIEAARGNRYGQRDATMILVAYRHGFRASEIVDLEWSAIDFVRAEMHVRRAKNGKPATHPIRGDELRELRKLRRESAGSFVFTSERGGPFTTDSFNWMVKRAGQRASCRSSATPTCSDIRQPTSSLATVTIRGQSRTTWVTAIFGTPCAIRSFRPSGSAIFGATENKRGAPV